MNYYNEIDPYAADWLQNLMDTGHIPAGDIDRRSITEVQPDDIDGYTQCHFFAGIAGWPLALRLAAWPDAAPVWTGSCPCQPFSAAGKGEGVNDERHLWPEFCRLIAECRPAVTFGEQVASKAGRSWLAGVRADLEALGYGVGAADLCAAGVNAPHIRQRLFWVADARFSASERNAGTISGAEAEGGGERQQHGNLHQRSANVGDPQSIGLGHTVSTGPQRQSGNGVPGHEPGRQRAEAAGPAATAGDAPDGMADAAKLMGDSRSHQQERESQERVVDGRASAWTDSIIIPCRDGKARRISSQPGDEPLAHGLPRDVGSLLAGVDGVDTAAIRNARRNRTGRLKGYGNAIVPELAAEFVRAWMSDN